LDSLFGHFTLRICDPRTHCTRGSVDPRDGLGGVDKNTPAIARGTIICLYRCGSLVADRKDLGWSVRAAPNISRGQVETLRHWCNCLINDAGCEVSTVAVRMWQQGP